MTKGKGNSTKISEKSQKNDLFRIASSTKLFVLTMVLQLVEEGKLNLKDKKMATD